MASKFSFEDQIRMCKQTTDKHLQALKREIDYVIDEAIQADKGGERKDVSSINKETDEKNKILLNGSQNIKDKLQKNYEERGKQLELNHTNAEKRRELIGNKQRCFHTDIENIAEEIERKIGELEKSWKYDTRTKKNTTQKPETVLKDQRAKEGDRTTTSVTDYLEEQINRITRIVSGVRFLKGASGREKYRGRIDGFEGEWKLIDTINFSLLGPILVGCIDECTAIITDSHTHHTYSLDMNTKHSQGVMPGTAAGSFVMQCASLYDGKVACVHHPFLGCTGDSLPGCISVYDSQWKLTNDVTIPQNTVRDATLVNVAADQDGMIVAAEGGQSKIYIIDPADGKVTHTITCKEDIVLRGVLSSGHIIATPAPPKYMLIIDRQGAHREIPHYKDILNVCVDSMTDALYVMTPHEECNMCAIDQVMGGGHAMNRRVASFPISTRLITGDSEIWKGFLALSPVMMTSSGRMIACNGESILVFKKLFSL